MAQLAEASRDAKKLSARLLIAAGGAALLTAGILAPPLDPEAIHRTEGVEAPAARREPPRTAPAEPAAPLRGARVGDPVGGGVVVAVTSLGAEVWQVSVRRPSGEARVLVIRGADPDADAHVTSPSLSLFAEPSAAPAEEVVGTARALADSLARATRSAAR